VMVSVTDELMERVFRWWREGGGLMMKSVSVGPMNKSGVDWNHPVHQPDPLVTSPYADGVIGVSPDAENRSHWHRPTRWQTHTHMQAHIHTHTSATDNGHNSRQYARKEYIPSNVAHVCRHAVQRKQFFSALQYPSCFPSASCESVFLSYPEGPAHIPTCLLASSARC